MKLPIVFFLQPAQEFTVRTAAQEMLRPTPPAWDGDGARNYGPCATHKKRQWRAKFRREILEMGAV
jgi:hypothetical protein